MRILAFDTATQTSGIAVVDGSPAGGTLAEGHHDASGRNADLLVAIDDVCKRAGISPRELDAVAVGAGPGSFTGLRIGMATAKGIAFAAKRPLWAVSSLAALAWDGYVSQYVDGAPLGVYVGVLDARRSEVFAGCYRYDDAGRWLLLGEERVLAPAELAAWAASTRDAHMPDAELYFAGDAIDAFRDALAPLADGWLDVKTPSGVAVAQLALAGPRTDILTTGTPTYIRPSEAEVMYPDGVPGALKKP